MKIESADQDIRTLLSSAYYRIPRFQRPYSWDRENVQEFWDDIVRDSPPDYFIGSMVVYRDGNQCFGVVDGQQRLTTITILLCVLRDALNDLGFGDLAEGIHGLVERRNIDNEPEFILATESSYPFFQDRIQKWGEPDVPVTPLQEEQNLQRAFDQLNLLVNGVVKSVQKDPGLTEDATQATLKKRLVGIRDALLDLKLITVRLEDEDDAYIIFETLNTRGKDLSLTDLVKNHLTKHLRSKSASVDQAKVKWERVLETIQGASVDLSTDAFLHHHWLSKYDFLPVKRLFKTLKKSVTKTKAKAFLDELVEDATIYRSIHETAFGKWTKQERRIEDALNALMLFRVKQQTPCVLSLVRAYRGGKIRKKHLERALMAIEKFHFFFTAITSQRSSGGISQMYASLGRRLSESDDRDEAVAVIGELRQKLGERVPSLDEFKALFPNLIYTENVTKERRLMKYTLVGLHKASPPPLSVDYEAMTVEHLVPQSAIGTGEFTDALVGQSGNLILVPSDLNDKLADKSFADKKAVLEAAKYGLPDDIKEASDWGKEQIEARTGALAEQAYNEIWKI